MVNYKNKKSLHLFFLLMCVCIFGSCTYDYFEDESNYVIYVPKADKNKRTDTYKIDDINIFIYNDLALAEHCFSAFPFSDNARTKVGNFHFRLPAGSHHVYCFTNNSEVEFLEIYDRSTARFNLAKYDNSPYFKEPQAILLERYNPNIEVPGPPIEDVAPLDSMYVGRICVVFKNMMSIDPNLTFDNISKVEILASNVGTVQQLEDISTRAVTRSRQISDTDQMYLVSKPYKQPFEDYEYGFANYYFPSPNLGEGNIIPIRLEISFLDVNNNTIVKLEAIDVIDKTGNKILHMNQTLIVAINGSHVQILNLDNPMDWKPNVEGGEEIEM